jgi:hypothetical protein
MYISVYPGTDTVIQITFTPLHDVFQFITTALKNTTVKQSGGYLKKPDENHVTCFITLLVEAVCTEASHSHRNTKTDSGYVSKHDSVIETWA